VALYRFFFHDDKTGTVVAVYVQCDSDEQAIAEARKEANGRRVVIWCDGRWVGVVKGLGN
jgi:hypothetical protein